jgi:DNA-binding CsgD family transcriptional regulator
MAEEGAGPRQIARILNCSLTTVKKVLEAGYG